MGRKTMTAISLFLPLVKITLLTAKSGEIEWTAKFHETDVK